MILTPATTTRRVAKAFIDGLLGGAASVAVAVLGAPTLPPWFGPTAELPALESIAQALHDRPGACWLAWCMFWLPGAFARATVALATGQTPGLVVSRTRLVGSGSLPAHRRSLALHELLSVAGPALLWVTLLVSAVSRSGRGVPERLSATTLARMGQAPGSLRAPLQTGGVRGTRAGSPRPPGA
jgi:hypothetical protein